MSLYEHRYEDEFNFMNNMKETKLKPFDLTKALAGEKVCTREGREVTDLHLLETLLISHNLIGVVGQSLRTFSVKGSNAQARKDFFMYGYDDSIKDLNKRLRELVYNNLRRSPLAGEYVAWMNKYYAD